MARMLASVAGLVTPDHCLILVLGTGFDEFGDPDFGQNRLCYGASDLLYLVSASNALHQAAVELEAWDGETARERGADWPDSDDTEVELTVGEIYLSAPMAERPISATLRTGPPGRYRVRVDVSGRDRIRALTHDADRQAMPVGVERFRVRLWRPGVG